MHQTALFTPCAVKKKCKLGCETDPELQDVDADKIMEQYGNWGLYQMIGYYCTMLVNFPVACAYFVMPFINNDPEMSCIDKNGNNLTEYYKYPTVSNAACSIKYKNNEEYKCGEYGTKLISTDNTDVGSIFYRFNLECSNYFVKEAGYTSFTIAAMLFVPIISHLSDKFGRKPMLVITAVLVLFLSLICGFLPKYWMFIVCRFFIGIFTDGLATIASILSCELVVQDMRSYVGLVYTFAWVSGYFYMGLISVFGLSVEHFYLLSVAPALLACLYLAIIPESPHWLVAHNKFCELKSYIQESTNFNKKSIDLNKCRISDSRKATRTEALKSDCQYKRAFRKPIFYFYILINGFAQFVSQIYYFALTYSSLELSKDPFTGYMLSGFIEIPGGLIVIPLMKYFGRKPLVIGSLFCQGLFIAMYPYAKELKYEYIAISLNLLGKLANGVLQVVHPILVAEMMPTKMRTVIYSVVNIPQSLGILLAPFVKYTSFGYPPLPMLNLAFVSTISGFLCILLPETKGKRLPEDISEMDEGLMGKCCGSKKKKFKDDSTNPDDTGFDVMKNDDVFERHSTITNTEVIKSKPNEKVLSSKENAGLQNNEKIPSNENTGLSSHQQLPTK